jgi:hypothetical protein
MGTWSTAIDSNDTFLDIYSNFYNLYNQGQDPIDASSQVIEMFKGEFEDVDTRNNALFGLALAQWETKAQNTIIFNKVKDIILTGQDLDLWSSLGADTKLISKRKVVLHKFLEKISLSKEKPKRRIKPKFDFKNIELVKITAPDGLKTFEVGEHYVNDKYVQTGSIMQWKNGGGSVLYFTGQGKKLSATWIDSQALEVLHDKDIVFTRKETTAYYNGDEVTVIYISQ